MADTEEYSIPSSGETLACSVDWAEGRPPPSVLCLHGGGPSGRKSTGYLGEYLSGRGRSVIRFDFSGHGDSTGGIAESSLEKRRDQALSVLGYFGIGGNVALVGSSMGGYVACALAARIEVPKLLFFGPAAYAKDAWSSPFGAGFTEILRREDSFLETDVPELLAGFSGDALLFMGEEDDVIPREVVGIYHQALSGARSFEVVWIEGCPHPIHRWAAERPEVREMLLEKVEECLDS